MFHRRHVVSFAVFMAFSTIAVPGGQQTGAQAKPPAQGRAEHAMGFDQDKTKHRFLLYEDGGAIEVRAIDAGDTTNRDAIRSHLPHITQMFGAGDFSAPMLVHDTNVPGTKELAALKGRIRYTYTELPAGGRVDIVTTDREALDAVHRFLRYQIADHKTGDSTQVGKRR